MTLWHRLGRESTEVRDADHLMWLMATTLTEVGDQGRLAFAPRSMREARITLIYGGWVADGFDDGVAHQRSVSLWIWRAAWAALRWMESRSDDALTPVDTHPEQRRRTFASLDAALGHFPDWPVENVSAIQQSLIPHRTAITKIEVFGNQPLIRIRLEDDDSWFRAYPRWLVGQLGAEHVRIRTKLPNQSATAASGG